MKNCTSKTKARRNDSSPSASWYFWTTVSSKLTTAGWKSWRLRASWRCAPSVSPQQRLAATRAPGLWSGRVARWRFPGGPARPGRTGLSLALIGVVFICLFAIFQVEQQRRIEELADIDSALLSDELPISAYADHGFNTYLKQNH